MSVIEIRDAQVTKKGILQSPISFTSSASLNVLSAKETDIFDLLSFQCESWESGYLSLPGFEFSLEKDLERFFLMRVEVDGCALINALFVLPAGESHLKATTDLVAGLSSIKNDPEYVSSDSDERLSLALAKLVQMGCMYLLVDGRQEINSSNRKAIKSSLWGVEVPSFYLDAPGKVQNDSNAHRSLIKKARVSQKSSYSTQSFFKAQLPFLIIVSVFSALCVSSLYSVISFFTSGTGLLYAVFYLIVAAASMAINARIASWIGSRFLSYKHSSWLDGFIAESILAGFVSFGTFLGFMIIFVFIRFLNVFPVSFFEPWPLLACLIAYSMGLLLSYGFVSITKLVRKFKK